jgi:hypothetical protein
MTYMGLANGLPSPKIFMGQDRSVNCVKVREDDRCMIAYALRLVLRIYYTGHSHTYLVGRSGTYPRHMLQPDLKTFRNHAGFTDPATNLYILQTR